MGSGESHLQFEVLDRWICDGSGIPERCEAEVLSYLPRGDDCHDEHDEAEDEADDRAAVHMFCHALYREVDAGDEYQT